MSLRNSFWDDDQPWSGLRDWAVPLLFRVLHSGLMASLRVSTSGVHRMTPFLEGREPTGALFVLWHDQTLFPLHLFRGAGIATMMSTSRNGRLWAQVWQLYGWPIVWGSTNKRAGILALRETRSRLRAGKNIGFTPDGPRGPRHQSHGGVVYLASKTPAPVYPIAFGASDAWILKTWDKYIIPKPGAHVHLHVGAPLHIPPDLTRQQTEAWQQQVSAALDESQRIARLEVEKRAGRVAAPPDLQPSRV